MMVYVLILHHILQGVTIGFEHGSYQISKHQNQGRLPVKIQVLQGTLGRTVLLRVKTRDGSAIG